MADPTSVYDQASRYAAKRLDEAAFLHWLMPRLGDRYAFGGWLDTRRLPFPGEPDRACDTVAGWVRRDGTRPPLATVVEFLTRPDANFLARLTRYAIDVELEVPFQEEPPRVPYEAQGVLVLLTGAMPDALVRDFEDVGLGGRNNRFRVLRLAEESAAATLLAVGTRVLGRWVLPWVPLMAGGGDPATAAAWRGLAAGEPDPHRRAAYGGLALVFAQAAGRAKMWRDALEGWDVETCDIVEEWIAKGEARGEARGLVQGRRDTLRANLLQLLAKRFGDAAAAAARPRLDAADADTLDRWFGLALDADAWEPVRAALGA